MHFTKKKIALLATLLALLCAFAAGALIFWFTSPLPMLLRLRTAVAEEDSVTFYDCLDEEDRDKARVLQHITGASLSRLVQYATNTTESDPDEKVTYRPRAYSRSGDTASLTLLVRREDGTETESVLHFVRRDGNWYLVLLNLVSES